MFSKDAHIFFTDWQTSFLYRYNPRRFLNVEILFTGCNTNVPIFFTAWWCNFSAYTTTCRNQYVFSGKYKKKELVHLPISTALTPKCKKEGRNIVFLRRKGIRTDPDISTCKTPVAAFQLLTSKDFDSAPRAHYLPLSIERIQIRLINAISAMVSSSQGANRMEKPLVLGAIFVLITCHAMKQMKGVQIPAVNVLITEYLVALTVVIVGILLAGTANIVVTPLLVVAFPGHNI